MNIEITAADRAFACILSNADEVLATSLMSGEVEKVSAKIARTLQSIAAFRLQSIADYVAGQAFTVALDGAVHDGRVGL